MAGKVVRRAAFDIGSGAMKVQVADVRESSASAAVSIVRLLYGEEIPVKFGVDLSKQTSGNLTEEIRARGLEVLSRLVSTARSHGAVGPFPGVATEVFRKAKNGPAYLDELRALGVKVECVSQETEAWLG